MTEYWLRVWGTYTLDEHSDCVITYTIYTPPPPSLYHKRDQMFFVYEQNGMSLELDEAIVLLKAEPSVRNT